jgi:hypothetical protein
MADPLRAGTGADGEQLLPAYGHLIVKNNYLIVFH